MEKLSPQQLAVLIELYYKKKMPISSIAVVFGIETFEVRTILLSEFESVQQASELSNLSIHDWPGTYKDMES